MKGTFFMKPLEFNIHILKESFEQGDMIKGEIKVYNHETADADLSSFGVMLALGDTKKIKNKQENAFSLVSSFLFKKPPLKGKEEVMLDFLFPLDPNCPISEKSSGLYLLCGKESDLLNSGPLELNITPCNWLSKFVETLVLFYRFKVKSKKSKKGAIEYKLQAPDSKEFGAITQLILNLKKNNEKILVNYQFKVKKLSYTEIGVKAKDEIINIDQVLETMDYKMFGDSVNQDGIKKFLDEALSQVKRKTLI